jgi:hypothetical protein
MKSGTALTKEEILAVMLESEDVRRARSRGDATGLSARASR